MGKISQLILCGSLAATVSSQMTQSPTKGTNLWEITKLTAPTLPAGQTGYWNDMDDFNFTKRVGLAWYFDRICPCQWGCDGRFCTWCANDRRLPAWYGKSKTGNKSSAELEEDLVGIAPEHNMGPLYDCTDNLETGVLLESTLLDVDRHNIQINEVHEYVGTQFEPKNHYAIARAASATATKWAVGKFEIRMIPSIVTVDNDLSNNWYRWDQKERTNQANMFSFVFEPKGLKYYDDHIMFWPHVYNRPSHYSVYNTFRFKVSAHNVPIPAGVDVLAYYQVFTQKIRGHAILDLMMSGRHAPRTLGGSEEEFTDMIHWKMTIPRVGYSVWINSGDAGYGFFYPKVNELLCGGATNPPMCRSHMQQNGRIVNRVRTEWGGYMAPYLNRTVYEWDMSLGDNWEERHNRRVISVDVLGWVGGKIFPGPVYMTYDGIRSETHQYPGNYVNKYGIQYNTEYPHLSYSHGV